MMRKVVLAFILAINTAGCAAEHSGNIAESELSSTTITSTMIQLEQPVHFTAPDGGPVVVEPNDYHVEQTTESHLRLVPEKGGRPILLAAVTTTHDIEVSKPFPLLLALNEDARNLVLLLPDGTALDAAGSLSGIQSRDLARPPALTSPTNSIRQPVRYDLATVSLDSDPRNANHKRLPTIASAPGQSWNEEYQQEGGWCDCLRNTQVLVVQEVGAGECGTRKIRK